MLSRVSTGGLLLASLLLSACSDEPAATTAPSYDEARARLVINHYADLALAAYSDALSEARELRGQLDALLAQPNEQTLAAARQAWRDARVPYMQTEVFRFGNAVVDEWEGQVNAWPLDEGLIDYVDDNYQAVMGNPGARANIIASQSLKIGEQQLDLSELNADLLASLNELGGSEVNVATGYHAIEFLLWGQDLNGTGPGAGARPATDFSTENCTHGNCARRAAYLSTTTDMLVDELAWMTAQWADGGAARTGLVEGDADRGIATILTGMGSLSYGELAGERMKLGLMLHDPEEEHDCFSDNTHRSHYNDALGIRNVYLGEYKRTDGSVVKGASLSAFVSGKDSSADTELRAALDATMNKMTSLSDTAEKGERYDQMLAEGNTRGNEIVQAAVDALTVQTRSIERVVAALGLSALEFEGSDSLDNPGAVFQ